MTIKLKSINIPVRIQNKSGRINVVNAIVEEFADSDCGQYRIAIYRGKVHKEIGADFDYITFSRFV